MSIQRNAIYSRPSMLHQPFTLAEVRSDNYRTRTLIFAERLAAEPGQFVMAWLPGVDEKPYCIASAEPLMLTVVAVGRFSEALHRLQAGERVWLRGPLGQGFKLMGRRGLLAGGGYGVAPLLFLAKKALEAGMEVEVCIGAQKAADVLLAADFERLGVQTHITTEDGSLGEKGQVTGVIDAAIRRSRPDAVYACGPLKMLEAVDRQCEQHHIARQLSWEAHMRCGMGLCGSCELPAPAGEDSAEEAAHAPVPHSGWLVCLDGPVSFTPGQGDT